MQAESSGYDNESTTGHLPAPSSSMLSRVTRQYHVMRLERNRLMMNWQQERKLSQLKAAKDLAAQLKRDEEHEIALERCSELEELLHREQLESARLKKSRDQEFKLRMLMEKGSTLTAGWNKNGPTSGSDQNVSSSSAMTAKSEKSPIASIGLTMLVSASHKDLLLPSDPSPAAPTAVNHATADAHGSEEISTIPKPWVVKKRPLRGEGTEPSSTFNCLRQPPLLVASPTFRSSDRSSPTGSCCAYSNSSAGSDRISEPSAVEGEGGRRDMQVSPIRPNLPQRGDGATGKISAPACRDNIEGVDASDTYLFPIRNRLKDLLKSVELEAGSFAQIRSKQKEREMLRSSHQRGSRVAVPIGFSNLRDTNIPLGASQEISVPKALLSDDNKVIFRSFVPAARKRKNNSEMRTVPQAELEREESADKTLMCTTLPSISVLGKMTC